MLQFLCKDLGGKARGRAAHSLEFSKAARTAMIALLWVVFVVVVSIMLVVGSFGGGGIKCRGNGV